VFEAAGCPACHVPPGYTSATSQDIWTGGSFQVPSLIGVSARLPVMHDGCAATLEDRFDPACGGDAHGPALSPADQADLIAFLETL
jgi:cytochrome c peroxidase